ncbi:MAG: transcriptional regulator [Flavobacteriaceae bacterium]|jgi:ribosome-binding protein aMBF1 (putative translation factor)|nr:transcriptional regulator [Flavobacteriaceae bacterium]|tara:strand:- start:22119 stop:22484 length:366 start_codon:yes stop_codon:yes gene_type:complete
MSEAAKKRPTKGAKIEINGRSFRVPKAKADQVLKIVKGYEEVNDSLPWREVLKDELEETSESAVALKGFRLREGMSQSELSEKSGVNQSHISEMERGKRPIGKISAQKLAKALNTSFKNLL